GCREKFPGVRPYNLGTATCEVLRSLLQHGERLLVQITHLLGGQNGHAQTCRERIRPCSQGCVTGWRNRAGCVFDRPGVSRFTVGVSMLCKPSRHLPDQCINALEPPDGVKGVVQGQLTGARHETCAGLEPDDAIEGSMSNPRSACLRA